MNNKGILIILSSVFALVILMIAGAEYYFLYVSEIQRLEKEIKELNETVEDRREKRDSIPGLKKKKQDLLAQEEQYKEILPTDREVEPQKFMADLDAIAKKAGVSPQNYEVLSGNEQGRQPGGSPASQGYEKTNYGIEVRGEIYPLFRYIWALENQKRLIKVDSFSLEVEEIEVPVRGQNQTARTGQNQPSNQKEVKKRTEYVGSMDLEITIYSYMPPQSVGR